MSEFAHSQAHWNTRFSTPDRVFGEESNDFLVSQASRLGHGHALALADGEGRNSVWLAQQGFTVDAFDFSAPAVAKAQALADKHHVRVVISTAVIDNLLIGKMRTTTWSLESKLRLAPDTAHQHIKQCNRKALSQFGAVKIT